MAARAGMATLIGQLRAATNVGTADYSIAGSAYWSDEQLQAELDRVGEQWRDVQLYPVQQLTGGGSAAYYDYEFPPVLGKWFEEAGANSGFAVKDGVGGSVDASGYTVNYQARKVTFSANQAGSVRLLDIRSYRFNAAAAQVWRWKAGNVSNRFDWSSDNMSVKRSQAYKSAMEMARYFAGLEGGGGISTSMMVRTDMTCD